MFKVPASHRGFLIEPRPEYWRRIIEENRRLICGLRPWTLGSAHQSGLCHPGVLFKELLVAGATFRRKAHLNCDTAEVKKRYLEIPRDSGTVRLDYYSPKEANCYFRAEVPSEDKIKGFIQKAPGSEGRDFFKGLLLARRDSTNAGELNVKSKQNFFKKYHCHLPQLYLSRMLPGAMYKNFLKNIYSRKEKFIEIYNDSIESMPYQCGIKKLQSGRLPLREIKGSGSHPKAVLLNIFLRLCVFDLYIQGVGESVYSIAADFIIREFFGLKPPRAVTASFTLYYGARDPQGLKKELKKERGKLRNMVQNPQKFALPPDKSSKIKTLAEKDAPSRKVHRQIENEKNKMRQMISSSVRQQKEKINRLENILRITSREYPFFVYDTGEMKYLFKKAKEETLKYR